MSKVISAFTAVHMISLNYIWKIAGSGVKENANLKHVSVT